MDGADVVHCKGVSDNVSVSVYVNMGIETLMTACIQARDIFARTVLDKFICVAVQGKASVDQVSILLCGTRSQ